MPCHCSPSKNQSCFLMSLLLVFLILGHAIADPQTNLQNVGCSGYNYNATDISNFLTTINSTISDIRRQLVNDKKHFATAQQPRSSTPVFAMIQCRNYLSNEDCLNCFDAAIALIRDHCPIAMGGRLIYDGCTFRREGHNFYGEATLIGNGQKCGNKSASQSTIYTTEANKFLKDLELATPKISDFYATAKTEVTNGNETIYAIAQCIETVTQVGCQDCLAAAYTNIQTCLPDTEGRAYDVGCFIRYSNTQFFPDTQLINITPFLRSGRSNKTRAIFSGIIGGIGFLLVLLALYLWYLLKTKRLAARKGDILEATELKGPLSFDYKDLKNATKNFHEDNKLGEGGFGAVYKGKLKNGNVVAVKRLTISSARAKVEFDSEVRLIGNVHHRNLIRLLGRSSNGADLLLVYEYMRNGSLDIFLHGEKRGSLSWKQRYNIIFGTARGLAYLHEQFHVCIIHRDMKSNNILLDDDFQPKIADFGLARLLPGGQSHVTTKFAGTLGYTAPEYAIYGHLSEKVDIYSFGVVVLEVISGRRSTDVKFEPIAEFLLEEAWKLFEKDMHHKLVDETIDPDEYTIEEVKKLIGIAMKCTQSPASSRPTMSEVVAMISPDDHSEQRQQQDHDLPV